MKDILKAVRNPATPERAELTTNNQEEGQPAGSQNDDKISTSRTQNQATEVQQNIVLQALVDKIHTVQEQIRHIMY